MTRVFLRSDYEPDTQGEENTVCKCCVRMVPIDVCLLVLQSVELFEKDLGRAVPLGQNLRLPKPMPFPVISSLGLCPKMRALSHGSGFLPASVMLPATMVVGCHPLTL